VSASQLAVRAVAATKQSPCWPRNGESAGELSGDFAGPLAVTCMQGDPQRRVQGGVRWRGRRSAVAPREVSHSRHHHFEPGRNMPLERQRLAIGSNAGGCGKAMDQAVTNCIDGESGNGGKTFDGSDEDINTSAIIIPSVEILAPIT
jgi:hypothetical protein